MLSNLLSIIWLSYNQWLDWSLDHLPILTIPIVSGLVGYITNILALKMTFYPLEYKGIGPIGWQGIIPSKATKMADLSVELMTEKLVDIEEIFSTLNPHKLAKEMDSSMKRIAQQLIDEVIDAQAPLPSLWHALPYAARDKIYQNAANHLPEMISEMMSNIKSSIADLLDLKALAKEKLLEDKKLINQIFYSVGKKEFRFIERSGFYFGFLFGLLQMTVFYFYNPWWALPVAGIFVGYFTNYFAIFLIFNPIKARKVLWAEFQGLFVKRQNEVSIKYAETISKRILTIDMLFDYLIRGPKPNAISSIIKKQVDTVVDSIINNYRTIIEQVLSIRKIDIIKNIIHYRFMEELPVAIRDAFSYAEDALQIQKLLASKMIALTEVEFVNFLRPVFQEDELKLILIGAFLGGLAGLAQYLLLFA